ARRGLAGPGADAGHRAVPGVFAADPPPGGGRAAPLRPRHRVRPRRLVTRLRRAGPARADALPAPGPPRPSPARVTHERPLNPLLLLYCAGRECQPVPVTPRIRY